MKYDVITIGSATRDVYVKSKGLRVMEGKQYKTGHGACFSLGSKLEVDELHFTTGGGSVNTAVTFAQQGLKTAALCNVGNDLRGKAIASRLRQSGADTRLMHFSDKYLTAYSVVLAAPSGERTIFVYRGATEHLDKSAVDLGKLRETKWLYISHLGGESAKLFAPLLRFAAKNEMKVALNPGSTQLKMGKKLAPFLNMVDVLLLNQEEASYLTDLPYDQEVKILNTLDQWTRGLAVMTKGRNGLIVSGGKTRWAAGILKEPKFVDRTGAGDAFGSGFVTALIRGRDIEGAMQLGSANATAVLGVWGANRGLLQKGDSPEKFGKLKIKSYAL